MMMKNYILFYQIILVIFARGVAQSNDSRNRIADKNSNERNLQSTDPQYIGCFRDSTDRALSFRVPGSRKTVDQCKTECKSRAFKYAGRQYLGECYCGDSGHDKHGTTTCNECTSNNVGGYKSCVYDLSKITGPPEPTPSPTPGPTGEPGSTSYLGCFQDTSSDRALPVRIEGNRKTAAQCQTECRSRGFKYAGRQYIGECYCGDSGYDKHGEATCNDCNSDNVGGYKSCVWELFSGPLPPTNPPTPAPTNPPTIPPTPAPTNPPTLAPPSPAPTSSPTPNPDNGVGSALYLGCFKDSTDRALSFRVPGSRKTAAQCQTECRSRGFKYVGRQYLGECYCGNSGYDKHGEGTCNDCNGDNVGGYKSCVWELFSGPLPPTTPPTHAPPTTVDPGNLIVDSSTGLKLSKGLQARLIASANNHVALTNGQYSQDTFYPDPDGAAIFPRPGGGWYYVINSEQWNRNSGVTTLIFNGNGDIEDYKVRITGTYRNCGGGKTPWGTWVSCEEYASGQCIQIDPSGARSPQVTNIGESSGGNFESFAYDDRNTQNPCFFATEDHPRGALRRYCPNVPSGVLNWDVLHQTTDFTRTYLKLIPTDGTTGTYEWTTSKTEGENSANAYYPNTEGIDRRNQYLFFVSKVKRRLVIVNLDDGTYRWESVNHRLFSGDGGVFEAEPDQVIFSLNEDNLFFTEDGGNTPGIYVRTPSGLYNTLVQAYHSMYAHDETVSLAFSPDGKRMYFGIQEIGRLFEVTRTDGQSFHHLQYNRALLRGSSSSSTVNNETTGPDLVMGLKFHTVPI